MSDKTNYLGEISPQRCVVLVCDVQERFAPSISSFGVIVENARRLCRAANVVGLPILATEQYPKGLGRTVPEVLAELKEENIAPKTKFTMVVPDLVARLDALPSSVDTALMCGVETHVCVEATCRDLIKRGMNVHVVADATSSRSQTDRHFALAKMAKMGAFINTTESVVLALAGDSADQHFKELQAIIKSLPEDTGLIPSKL